MKTKLARILDEVFLGVAVWLLAMLISFYFINEFVYCVLAGAVVALAVTMFFRVKGRKTQQILADKAAADLVEQHFLFNDEEYALEYCHTALKKRYETAEKLNFCIKIKDTLVIPHFSEPLSLRKLVKYYSEALRMKAKTLVVLAFRTEKFGVDVGQKLCDLRLEILESDKIYQLFKQLDSLPSGEKPIKRHRLREFFKVALSPKRAKAYLFCMFALLFSAYFSLFSIYFIVMSAVCLSLVIACKLDILSRFSKPNQTKQN